MRVVRYHRDFSRRKFLADAATGCLGLGVLAPLSKVIAATGDVGRAYPEELLSVENYTRGRIKTGDVIDASNVEHVKDLLEPVRYEQIVTLGRKLRIIRTTTDVMRLSPWDYIEATLRNAGKAAYDARGNVINKADGQPWIGGNPFPNPRSAVDLVMAQTMNWGRHDASFYAMTISTIERDGSNGFNYSAGWAEMSPVARVTIDPKPYWPEHKDKLRYHNIFFLTPATFRGTAFLNVWDYDQSTFPELYGYLPEFRRTRQLPTDQRFEPLIPGASLFLSDAWGAGDPLYTWGNYRIVGRGPFLGGVSGGWNAEHPNWEHKTHGGPKGNMFWDADVELIPEVIIIEAEPTRFPRAPISKRRLWFDARMQLLAGMITYDRNGKPYRSFDGAYGLYESGERKVMDGKHPYWSWCHVTASDVQTGSVTRLEQVRELEGRIHSNANDPAIYEKYLTQTALAHLGTA